MRLDKILIVIDKIELKYFEFNDLVTNFWIIKELLNRGENVFITTIDKLFLKSNEAFCHCFETFEKSDDIFYKKNAQISKIEDFSLVLFRPDPPVDMDYISATYIFDFVNPLKTNVINNPNAIRSFNEKLHANLFNEFMPKNIVTANKNDIEEFLEENNEIILKPLNKCFGSGVMYLKKGDKNTRSIINTVTNNENTLTMVQKYLSNAQFGDKRVLILGETVLDECVVKVPTKDDFKFNTHSDEYIKKATLTSSEKQKFTQIAKELNSLGLCMAGLDVIDEQIIEVNVTSPCYFVKEINKYFSTHIEIPLCDFILTKSKTLATK